MASDIEREYAYVVCSRIVTLLSPELRFPVPSAPKHRRTPKSRRRPAAAGNAGVAAAVTCAASDNADIATTVECAATAPLPAAETRILASNRTTSHEQVPWSYGSFVAVPIALLSMLLIRGVASASTTVFP